MIWELNCITLFPNQSQAHSHSPLQNLLYIFSNFKLSYALINDIKYINIHCYCYCTGRFSPQNTYTPQRHVHNLGQEITIDKTYTHILSLSLPLSHTHTQKEHIINKVSMFIVLFRERMLREEQRKEVSVVCTNRERECMWERRRVHVYV